MRSDIIRILSPYCDPAGISFEEKGDRVFVNLPCYALAGSAIETLLRWVRENDMSCVLSIQEIANPHLQIVL